MHTNAHENDKTVLTTKYPFRNHEKHETHKKPFLNHECTRMHTKMTKQF